jgi:hypothetical protein
VIKEVTALNIEANRFVDVAFVDEEFVVKKLVEVLFVVMRLVIVAEATVRSEIVVVASVVVPFTVKRLDTVEVPALRVLKIPFVVPNVSVKKYVAVALPNIAFLANRLVVVLLVVEALVATKLVDVEKINEAFEEKRLVEDARVEKNVVEVLLVITDDDANSAPFNVSVFADERYRDTSPNDIPPTSDVEEAKDRRASGVVVPNPKRLFVLS